MAEKKGFKVDAKDHEIAPSPAQPSEKTPVPAAAPPGRMTCPRCSLEQPRAEDCVGCGVMIQNYLAQKSKLSETPPNITLRDTAAYRLRPGQRILRALILLPLVVGLFFFMLQKNITRDPRKYKLMSLANTMANNLETCSRTVRQSEAFTQITEQGYPIGGKTVTAGQLSFLIQQSLDQSTEPEDSVIRIAAALEQQGVRRSILSSNRALAEELSRLKRQQADFSSLHQKVLGGLIQFYDLYTGFTELALSPEKQRTLMAYHIQFRVRQGYVMAAYADLVEAMTALPEKGFGKNKQRWLDELKTARKLLNDYRESGLYFNVPSA